MEKLLTLKEVAKILGISETTAKIWASRRVFPVVKVGRLIRISPCALQEWVTRNTEECIEDMDSMKLHKPKKLHRSGSFENFFKGLKKNGEL
jgi:excisionase family DNA binding protein